LKKRSRLTLNRDKFRFWGGEIFSFDIGRGKKNQFLPEELLEAVLERNLHEGRWRFFVLKAPSWTRRAL